MSSDAVAASSKATFEAAQSALKVVDSDAVKNALNAPGTARATRRPRADQDPPLYRPSRSTRRPSTRRRSERPRPRRRPPETAPRSASSKPRPREKLSPRGRCAGINRGAAAGKKISASVDAKTLTTNLDAGMKQLGKNLAVDVDAKAIQASFASAGSKLASIDTSGIDRAVQKASAGAAKEAS